MDKFQAIEDKFRLSQEFCNKEMHYFLTIFHGISERMVTLDEIFVNHQKYAGVSISKNRIEEMIKKLMRHDLFAGFDMPIVSKHEVIDKEKNKTTCYVFDTNMFMLTQIGEYYKN